MRYIYPFQTGLESEEKGLSSAQIFETPLQKQTNKKTQREQRKENKETNRRSARLGVCVGKRYSLSNAGLLNRQASL